MKLVVLGLSLSSSWGNGHATTYRALLKAFAARGHEVVFLERDQPWYAAHRDLVDPAWCRLSFYKAVEDLNLWRAEIASADAVIVGSYVPDGIAVGRFVQAHAKGVTAFYDIDTPITLKALEGDDCAYVTPAQIPRYQLYLSFSGGPVLRHIEERYGSPAARPLYCSVDTDLYRAVNTNKLWDLSYLGTYSMDRQPVLHRLLVEAAEQAPDLRFCVAGPQYPDDINWPGNVERIEHVAPSEHAAFYGASRWTLNVTRADMVRIGYSPSVRLFEAAACATPIISDKWHGIETLFRDGREIRLADRADDVLAALRGQDETALGSAARLVIEHGHSASHRAAELEHHLHEAAQHLRDGWRAEAQGART